MKPLRSSSSRAIASLLVVSMTAVAQPLPQEELAIGREVVVTGAPGERPAAVYGAANVGVQLVFDAPLQRTDAGTATLRLPGGDLRLHPYLENSLFVTPSSALSSGPAVPLYVPLTDGGVPLLLAFHQERVDHVLRVLRRPPAPDAGAKVSRDLLLQEALSVTASAIFKDDTCAPLQSQQVRPIEVKQGQQGDDVLVCAAGMLNYLRVLTRRPECTVSSARVLREGKDVEVLLLEPARSERGGSWQVLAVWSPPEKADFELLLLAADGTVCDRYEWVALSPGGSP